MVFKLQLTSVQSAGGGSAYLDVSAILKILRCELRQHSFQTKTQQFLCLTTTSYRIYIYWHLYTLVCVVIKINNEYSPSMEVIPSWTNFWAPAGLWIKTLINQWLMKLCCREASASIQRLYHWCTLTSQNKPNVTPLNGYLMLKSLKCMDLTGFLLF